MMHRFEQDYIIGNTGNVRFDVYRASFLVAGLPVDIEVETERNDGNGRTTDIQIKLNEFQPLDIGVKATTTAKHIDVGELYIRATGNWEAEAIAKAFRFISDVLLKKEILIDTKKQY